MTVENQYGHNPNPKVVVTSISFGKSTVLREELLRAFPNAIFNENGQRLSGKKLIEFIGDADAAIVGVETINDSILKYTPELKIISKYGVGLDSIDQESLKNRNISLGWKGGINRRSVSELTLCFMLGLCRNVFDSGFKLKKSEWDKNGGYQLSGKAVGIIGCGHVGSDVVRLLSPLNCKVLVQDIIDKSDFCQKQGASETSLGEVIERSDIISLHVPLTELTRHIVNENFLKRMKSTAFLINTCRGEVIDQEALKNALHQRLVAGAALDVFLEEPPTDEEFLSLPNLMVTPHIGGNAREAVEAMGRSAIDHLTAFFKKNSA
ncbi:MAG: hydroxyacid dehydrogenase [Chloroflexi bacterium]|jgi:D-3-phosphoglycerate dehydrogenase|nr:hydroxyacid dehydrogenase [Chloroflexota bacterium]|tara:strand:+ start:1465 stop:2430 length:966 start_codon:yes stop_codon:yes gene_type:complete